MVRKRLVIASILIALLIFSSGILAGWVIERYTTNRIYNQLVESELDTESYLIEQNMIDVFGGDKCELLEGRVDDIRWSVHRLGRELNTYDDQLIISPREYDTLLRRYYIFEIKFLTTVEQMNMDCGTDYTTIIFFYKIGDIASKKQGAILDVYSQENNFEPVVISLNAEFDEPLIDFLKNHYEINSDAPALIINGQVVKGLVSKEDIYTYAIRTTPEEE